MITIYEDEDCTKPILELKFGEDITLKTFNGEKNIPNVIDTSKPIAKTVFIKNNSIYDFVIQEIHSSVKGFEFELEKSVLEPQSVTKLTISCKHPALLTKLSAKITIKGVSIVR